MRSPTGSPRIITRDGAACLTKPAMVIAAENVSGNIWRFHGTVSDEFPAGLTVYFGGLSCLQDGWATVQSDGINTDLPSTTTIRYPAAFRIDAVTPAGKLVQVFSAGKYWVQDPSGVHDGPG